MRLLNSHSLRLKTFLEDKPPYAILSHTWGEDEVNLQELLESCRRRPSDLGPKFKKIVDCCKQARKDGLEWVWIDTCCIDKTSSVELAEAINSMYKWYAQSEACYALLQDVPPPLPKFPEDAFRRARWFTRGWCLQELVAPPNVEFYAQDWSDIGTKRGLASLIEEITSIPTSVLHGESLETYTIAERFSWASDRNTSRLEDQAYSLLGIFDIHMPLIYGEGEKAFMRLQEELLRQTEDLSFLLWSFPEMYPNLRQSSQSSGALSVLASSPASFSRSGARISTGQRCEYHNIKLSSSNTKEIPQVSGPWRVPQITSRGLHVESLVITPNPKNPDSVVFWTGLFYGQHFVCIALRRYPFLNSSSFGREDPSQVLLVSSDDICGFFRQDLYLNIRGSTWDCPRNPWQDLKAPQLHPDLDLLLPYHPNAKVILIDTLPRIPFLVCQGKKQQTMFHPPPSPQLYCPDIGGFGEATESSPTRSRTILAKFKVSRSWVRMSSVHFIVLALDLGLEGARCGLVTSSSTDVLPDYDSVCKDLEMSDRATLELADQSVIYAVMKSSVTPRAANSGLDQRRRACFVLQLALRTQEKVIT